MLQILVVVTALLLSFQNPEPAYTCPDGGGHIAFSASGLKLLDTANGDVTTLVEIEGDSVIDQFSWSPDGTRLAFDTNQSGTWGIYVLEVSEDGEALSEPELLFDSPAADESLPRWSPDGTHLAFTLDGRLYIAVLDGGDPRDLSVDTRYILWSSDGSQLLYTINNDTTWTLGRADAATGNLTELTGGEGTAYPYNISPSGALLLEIRNHTDNSSRTIAVATDSGEVINFEPDEGVSAWSPDGARIAYTTWINDYQMGNEIIVMDKNGENSEILTENFLIDVMGSIQWSPDGTRIAFDAFHMNYEYTGYVHVLEIETHEVQVFEEAALSDTPPQWRPCAVS